MAGSIHIPDNLSAELDSVATTSVLVPASYTKVQADYVSLTQTYYRYYQAASLVATLLVTKDSLGRFLSVEKV